MTFSCDPHSILNAHPCRRQCQGKTQAAAQPRAGRTLPVPKAEAGVSSIASTPRPPYQWHNFPRLWSGREARWTPLAALAAVDQSRLLAPASTLQHISAGVSTPFCPSRPISGRLLVVARAASARSKGAADGSTGQATSVGATAGVVRAAVGIDLGTTTSAVALAGPDGRPVVVEDELGRAVIPSVVFVRQDGSVLVGDAAAAAAESDPSNAFYGIKRLLGRTYREALEEVDELNARTAAAPAAAARPAATPGASSPRSRLRSYTLAEGRRGEVEVACPALGRNLTPEEISAHLLRHLVYRASSFLDRQRRNLGEGQAEGGGGVSVLDAVITVPAHFGPRQRRAVTDAARAAGLQRVTLLQEPIAAAMAYGFGSPHVPYDVLLVFDLGGGTLDLTIVEAFEGIMEVLSTSGDNYLGGDDFTAAVADWMSQQLPHESFPPTAAAAATATSTTSPPAGATASSTTSPLAGATASSTTSPPAGATCSSCSWVTHPAQALSAPDSVPASTSTAAPLPSFASASGADPHSLALLRAAEAAKLALSEAVAAARSAHGSSSSSSSSSTANTDMLSSRGGSAGGSLGSVSVRVPLPSPLRGSSGGTEAAGGPAGRRSGPCGAAGGAPEVELTLEAFEELVRPLLRRIWWPLEDVAMSTRTQLGGRLPPALDPRGFEAESGSGSGSGSRSSLRSGSGSGSVWDMEGPGRREGAAAWEFSIFPSPTGSGATTAGVKYVAPPRRLSGLVLVGAATRLPVVRDYITEVTGLPVRPGVDPETAVALGAALHAGLMVGDVTRGIEMNDGGYVAGQHGRASGFQVAVGATANSGSFDAPAEDPAEPELVWEP